MVKKAPFQSAKVTEAELEYAAENLIQALQPERAFQGGVTSLTGFWTGEVYDTTTLDIDHMITVRIAGESQRVHCNLSNNEVAVGEDCYGYIDQAGEYWFLGQHTVAGKHTHRYSDGLLGDPAGIEPWAGGTVYIFATPYFYGADLIDVKLNGADQRREDYTQMDNAYIQPDEATEPDDDLQASYVTYSPAAQHADGSYVVVAEFMAGEVIRCQNVLAANPSWEMITQQGDFGGGYGNVADILIPSWAPVGMAFLCGDLGVWRTSNLFETDPTLVRWVPLLEWDEIVAVVGTSFQVALAQFVEDPDRKRIYLLVSHFDTAAWIAYTDDLGGTWSWSAQIAGATGGVWPNTMVLERLELGPSGDLYYSYGDEWQECFVYRSQDGGDTFALLISESIAPDTQDIGAGIVIHKQQSTDAQIVIAKWDWQKCQYGSFASLNVSAGLPAWDWWNLRAFQYDPSDHRALYATIGENAQKYSCYKSTDHGASFSNIADITAAGEFLNSVVVFGRNSNYLYCGAGQPWAGGGAGGRPLVYVSVDGGATWTDKTGTFYADVGWDPGTGKPAIVRIIPVEKLPA